MTIRLFFLIRSLDSGGTERQLIELVKGLDKAHYMITVVTFYDGGALRCEIEELEGVRIVSLHKRGRWDIARFLWQLARLTHIVQPHVIHGYADVSNELALLMGRAIGARVVWGIRRSSTDLALHDWAALWTFRTGAWLSRFVDAIIINSHVGKRQYIAHHYCGTRMLVIPNGIDTERFQPDIDAGQRLRHTWGVAESERLIGLVGRLVLVKDHPSFLRAAARLASYEPHVRFICVGDGPAAYRRNLHELTDQLGLRERVIWAGAHSDMPAVYNALDIAVSSSISEGFPNVIGEAMACGVPCVVTNVGDSAMIVGDTGYVIPSADPAALANAWCELLHLPPEQRAVLAQRARERIVSAYSVSHLVNQTQAALLQVLERPRVRL